MRSKVNDALITGLRVVDTILPCGKGQRQLILGDRYTGKTSLFLSLLITSSCFNFLSSMDGFGTKRLLGIYIGINQSLSKIRKFILFLSSSLSILSFSIILSTDSSSKILESFILPTIGIAIAERIQRRKYDSIICFDDLSKHSKGYRQISLIIGKIPSREAFPTDIFNIHSSLLERCGKLRLNYFGGSITAFPVIETINDNLTEFIATNVVSITDGQFVLNTILFKDSILPAIDSGLSVSRIGSNAQCKLMKRLSSGLKNEFTNYRFSFASISTSTSSVSQSSSLGIINPSVDQSFSKYLFLNLIFFQDYLQINSVEFTMALLLAFRSSMIFSLKFEVHRLFYILSFHSIYLLYFLFISKHYYSLLLYLFLLHFLSTILFFVFIIFRNGIGY